MEKISRKIFKRLASIIIAILMVYNFTFPVYASASQLNISVDDAIEKTYEFMVKNPESFGGKWSIVGLARSHISVDEQIYETYYESLVKELKDNNGVLSERKYTEYSGSIVALTAIGKDPSNVAGYNLISKLSEFDKVIFQGVNGGIWALIALDTGGYNLPNIEELENASTREKLIDFILSHEIDGGGWSMDSISPDPDVTAMALQSLAKYKDMPEVKAAIDRGVDILSRLQEDNGGYSSWGVSNVESSAQVLVALCSLGIDPVNDERFIKDGNNLLSNLMQFYNPSRGGFSHREGSTVDLLATEQGFYSLVAYKRLSSAQSSLYDMSQGEKKETSFRANEKIMETYIINIILKLYQLVGNDVNE